METLERQALGRSGRRDPAPPQRKKKEAAPTARGAAASAAAAGRKGAEGNGEAKRRPAAERPAEGSAASPSPERKGRPQAGKEGAVPSGKKASLKNKEGVSKARGAEPAAAPVDPAEKERASRVKQERAPGEDGSGAGRADGAIRKRPAGQKANPPPAGEAPHPGEKERAPAAGGGKGRNGSPKEKDEEGLSEKQGDPKGRKRSSRRKREGEEERCVPKGKGPGVAEGAAAKDCAPPRANPEGPEEESGGSGVRRRPSRAAPPSESQILRLVLEKLKLAQEERSVAAQRVKNVRDRLVTAIKKVPCFRSIEILGAGSYYERVKICSPNEFDIMLKIPNLRLELEPCEAAAASGAFYYVKLKRDPANKTLKDFCDGERLSSYQMLSKLRCIIIEEVKKIEDMEVSVERKRPGCPAVTLLIGSPPSVISVDIILGLEFCNRRLCFSTEDGVGIETWLGTKVKKSLQFEPLFLVPKNVKDGGCFTDNIWRLSFSKIEKMLLHNHGQTKTCCETKGVKCCRKDCLKLLKHLLEQLKTRHENRNQFDKFYSYQVKTAFFHACVKWPKDDDWLAANLEECFKRLLNYFLDCLKEAKLPHFFIPTFNLLCEEKIERTKCNALVRAIERERNNRFPIFLN